MAKQCNVLPRLVELQDFSGDYFSFEDAVYQGFRDDFISAKPIFQGKELGLKRLPLFKNKEATFWHIVGEGPNEASKLPNLRRYERIKWPKYIIDNCTTTCPDIKIWENVRKGEGRFCIWCEEREFLIILADRGSYVLFWTAYPVTEDHTIRKLRKEYDEYIKNQIANAAQV